MYVIKTLFLVKHKLFQFQAKEKELETLEAILKDPSSLPSIKANHPDILEHIYGEHIASSTQRYLFLRISYG